jgi:hypothetical protein
MRGAVGVLAVLLYAIHGTYNVLDGHPEHLLWACHVGVLLVSASMFLRSPTLNAMGLFWLLAGVPLWLLDLSMGGELIPTSFSTHVGGPILGVIGLRWMGMPRGAWWKAVAAFLVLQQITRWTTPARENVNVAFGVWTGWENIFPAYIWYMALLVGAAAVAFLVAEIAGRRIFPAARRNDDGT